MTIFLKLAQELLNLRLEAMLEASGYADDAWYARARSLFSVPRNTALSALKREKVAQLKHNIGCIDVSLDDISALNAIKSLIDTCVFELEGVRQDYLPGSTERNLTQLSSFIDILYRKLELMAVLDTPSDQESMNVFKYYLAKYCAKKAQDSFFSTWIEQGVRHPRWTRAARVIRDKENLLLGDRDTGSPGKIALCQARLDELNPELVDLEKRQTEIVVRFMYDLQLENLSLYETSRRENGFDLGVPMQGVVFDYTHILPGGGYLGACLRDATATIRHRGLCEQAVDDLIEVAFK